ncbi:MAG: hypothetical protein M3Z30_12545 [Gemmatimonadota bacterium]|nr:hypothetical protein [Gemmatimonadota bacterium]
MPDFVTPGPIALVAWGVFSIAIWAIPLIFAIWLIRTLTGMLEAQRAIVEQLRLIAQQGRVTGDARVQ